jgi:hypothetical protein
MPRRPRSPSLVPRTILPGGAVLFAVLGVALLLPSGLGGAVAPANRTLTVRSATFSSAGEVVGLASQKSTSLNVLALTNGSTALDLYDAKTGKTTVVQATVPGGFYTEFDSVIAAGHGSFFVSFENGLSGRSFFDRVTLGGTVHHAQLPLSHLTEWDFAYGSPTELFATSFSGELLEVDPNTMAVIANLTSLLPPGVGVSSVLPVGPLVYIAGSVLNSTTFTARPYFGVLSPATSSYRNLSLPGSGLPGGYSQFFGAIVAVGHDLWVGGGELYDNLTSFTLKTVSGLLYRYAPATGSFRNETGLLPSPAAPVFGSAALNGTAAFETTQYSFSISAFNMTGGIYALTSAAAGPALVNLSSHLPSGFVPAALDEVSASDGWFFCGGESITSTTVGATVALRG